ncbi:hypothetical protein BJX70DRAFT_49772 [Aspergillus crustosus]
MSVFCTTLVVKLRSFLPDPWTRGQWHCLPVSVIQLRHIVSVLFVFLIPLPFPSPVRPLNPLSSFRSFDSFWPSSSYPLNLLCVYTTIDQLSYILLTLTRYNAF